jgi:hypothetical protein
VPTQLNTKERLLHAFRQVGAEGQAPFGDIAGHQRLQTGFEDVDLARLELSDDFGVVSMQVTWLPISARQAAATSPT